MHRRGSATIAEGLTLRVLVIVGTGVAREFALHLRALEAITADNGKEFADFTTL